MVRLGRGKEHHALAGSHEQRAATVTSHDSIPNRKATQETFRAYEGSISFFLTNMSGMTYHFGLERRGEK
jgi:hypothetical protein